MLKKFRPEPQTKLPEHFELLDLAGNSSAAAHWSLATTAVNLRFQRLASKYGQIKTRPLVTNWIPPFFLKYQFPVRIPQENSIDYENNLKKFC